MRFHQLEFLGRQAAPFVQNRVGNRDLAHVMGDGPDADELNLIFRNALAKRRVPQQAAGNVMQAADMLARLVAAELNGGGERLHHAHAQLRHLLRLQQQLIPLPLHLRAQKTAGPEQLHHRIDTADHKEGHHGLENHVHHAELIRLPHGGAARLRGNQEHRNPRGEPAGVQLPEHLDAVHAGHHHVEQNGPQAVAARLDHAQALQTVRGLENGILRAEEIGQDGPVDLLVIHNQNRLFPRAVRLVHL